jgi:hypothetical protein
VAWRARETAAVESARVGDHHRPLRPHGHREIVGSDRRFELLGRHIPVAVGPGPKLLVAPAFGGAAHVLERPGFLVDVREIGEHLDHVRVLRVTMPPLRVDAVDGTRIRDRVPLVDLVQPVQLASVAVHEVEQRLRRGESYPGRLASGTSAFRASAPSTSFLSRGATGIGG